MPPGSVGGGLEGRGPPPRVLAQASISLFRQPADAFSFFTSAISAGMAASHVATSP